MPFHGAKIAKKHKQAAFFVPKIKLFAYICTVKRTKRYLLSLLLLAVTALTASAQIYTDNALPVDIYKGDTIPVIHMRDIYIYSPPKFKNRRTEKEYWRNVRDIKKTLPLAQEIRGIIIETYEYMQTLPDDKARERHMKKVEKDLMATYTPRMKQLTLRQGKMLIKLVDRECNQTGYDLIVVFRGKFRATFYQAFAALFGASLKSGYDPDGADAELEEIIWLVENDIL